MRSSKRILGMTSSKALVKSKNRHAVASPLKKLMWILEVSIERLSKHERDFLKPY